MGLRDIHILCGAFVVAVAGGGVVGVSGDDLRSSLNDPWHWREFGVEDGLPSKRTWGVCEARDGVMWATSQQGPAWYDGYHWHAVIPADWPDAGHQANILPFGDSGVLVRGAGNLYIGSQDGFRRFSLGGEDPDFEIEKAVVLRDAELFILTRSKKTGEKRLFKRAGEDAVCVETPAGESPYCIWGGGDSNLWAYASSGIYWRDGDSWKHYLTAIPGKSHDFTTISWGDGYFVWINHPLDVRGVWRLKVGDEPRLVLPIDFGQSDAFAVRHDGTIVTLLDSGVIHIRENGVWSTPHVAPRQFDSVNAATFDTNGNLWVATSRGLHMHLASDEVWEHWKNPAPRATNRINEIIKTDDDDIWITSSDGLEIRGVDGEVRRLFEIAGTEIRDSTGLAQDGWGNIWLTSGAVYEGAFRFDGKEWSYFGPDQGLHGCRHKVRIDRRGRPWFLGLSYPPSHNFSEGCGAAVLTDAGFEHWTVDRGMLHDRVYAFAEGLDGAYWFGTMNGLSRWKDGVWKHWTQTNGLSVNKIWAVAVDDDGGVWFSDRTSGVGRVEDDSIRYIHHDDGLFDRGIWDIRPDPAGGVWVSGRNGIARLKNSQVHVVPADSGIGHDGMWPVLPTQDRVYVGTIGAGTSVLNRRELEDCDVRIAFGEPLRRGGVFNVSWRAASRGARVHPRDIETRWRLDDGFWSNWSLANRATVDPPPGDHTLSVQARGRLSESPLAASRVSLAIPLPPHRQPTVIAAVAGAAAIIAALIMFIVVRQMQHNRALRTAKTRFRRIFGSDVIGVFVTDARGDVVDANDAFLRTVGFNRPDLPISTRNLVPEGGSGVQREVAEQLQANGVSSPMETELLCADGTVVPVLVSAAMLSGDSHQSIAVTLDLTVRKRVETRLLETASQLERVGKRLEHLLRAAGEVMSAATPREALQAIADAVHEAGWGSVAVFVFDNWAVVVEAFAGMTDEEIQFIAAHARTPEERARNYGEARAAFRVSQSYFVPAEFVEKQSYAPDILPSRRATRAGENWRELDLAYVPLYGQSGDVIGSICMDNPSDGQRPTLETFRYLEFFANLASRTVENLVVQAERQHEEETRRSLEAQLRQSQKMEAVGQLAGGMAHDFNNILTAIQGNVELVLDNLKSELPPGDPLIQGLQQVEEASKRAVALTSQLLMFSRREVARPEVVNLNSVLRGMESMLRSVITEDIDLRIETTDGLPNVYVDRNQIEQVIMNLVVNAHDATPNGGTLLLATATATIDECDCVDRAECVGTRPGLHVLLTVVDAGEGIDADTLERIFEPFYTTKPVGSGTGLGLSTVYGIVRQAGGCVRVESEPGRGSTFRVYLPVTEIPAAARAPRPEHDRSLSGCETILVCEDDDAVRGLAARILKGAGYDVIVAENGRRALEITRACSAEIDLLLTDVVMPEMNGKELSDALSAERPAVKTLFVSGYAAKVIARHGALDEGVCFIEKPYTRKGLLARVRAVLDGE